MKWCDPDSPPEYQDKVLLATTRPPVTESPDRLRGFRFGYWSASSGKWHIDEGWNDERVVGWMPLIGMPHPADPRPAATGVPIMQDVRTASGRRAVFDLRRACYISAIEGTATVAFDGATLQLEYDKPEFVDDLLRRWYDVQAAEALR